MAAAVSCHTTNKMIARFYIQLPFALTIPENEPYTVYVYKSGPYNIKFFFPVRGEKADSYFDADNIKLSGKKAFNADILRIDFQKKSFNRKKDSEDDPPIDLVETVANNFLARLRYVTNASRVKLIKLSNLNWSSTYLTDNESQLRNDKRYIRGRGMRKYEFSYIVLNKQIWDNIHSIQPDYALPVWKTLLLDAGSILPEIGPAIILTFTALEVFISKTLDDIVATKRFDNDFWEWVNNRGFFLKNPTIEEKYDFLSRHLIGKSIKDNKELWESFKHLQKARNSFAHTGVAMIGNEIVTEEKARNFIDKANEIIELLKNELPQKLRWPEFKNEVKLEFSQVIFKPEEESS